MRFTPVFSTKLGLFAVSILSICTAACGGDGGGSGGDAGMGGSGGGSIAIETIDDAASENVSIAIDSAGVPHVSYRDGVGNVKYAFRTGAGEWDTTTTVDDTGDTGRYASIAVDDSDMLAISYQRGFSPNPGALAFASLSGSTWTTEDCRFISQCRGSRHRWRSLAVAVLGLPTTTIRTKI